MVSLERHRPPRHPALHTTLPGSRTVDRLAAHGSAALRSLCAPRQLHHHHCARHLCARITLVGPWGPRNPT
eukprot:857940-Pyramimonas_sp.AAC.1